MAPDGRGPQPRVVIIGCGFAGLAAARTLADAPLQVTVVDRTNHHLFQPLLYQVATAGLAAPAIATPIRHVLRRAGNITTLMDEVAAIDTSERTVTLAGGSRLGYDFLIVAAGAAHSYFGHDGWAAWAPGLKTLDDAQDIRRRILLAFERAEGELDPARRQALLSFVIVGGGATGVELAGTLAEIARCSLAGEFRRIDTSGARVMLIEAGERVLPAFPAELSERARRQLEALGVEVRTGSRVEDIDGEGVTVDGQRIAASTVLWAAGVAASPLGSQLPGPRDRSGRLQVAPDLSLPGFGNVFVAGDLAAASSDGRTVPGIAPAAKQMGRHAARNVLRALAGREMRAFRYRDQGDLATLGRQAAVARIGRLRLWGYPAWVLWLFAHVYFLIGFRNRLVVLIDWAWAYWTAQRSARIIFGSAADERVGIRSQSIDARTRRPAAPSIGAPE